MLLRRGNGRRASPRQGTKIKTASREDTVSLYGAGSGESKGVRPPPGKGQKSRPHPKRMRPRFMVPEAGVEPAPCRQDRILSYLLHTEYRRTQPPVEVVDGHQKALPILLFLKLMCKKLRFVCHFRSFQFGRKFWILEGHRRDVTHKRSATAHAVDLSITNTL